MKYLNKYTVFIEAIKLPSQYYVGNDIIQMKVGQIGYTVPWALKINYKGECFLDGYFNVDKKPGGTVQLKIKRVKEGYIAYIHELKKEDVSFRKQQPDFIFGDNFVEIISFGDEKIEETEDDLKAKLDDAIKREDYREAELIKKKLKKNKKWLGLI